MFLFDIKYNDKCDFHKYKDVVTGMWSCYVISVRNLSAAEYQTNHFCLAHKDRLVL